MTDFAVVALSAAGTAFSEVFEDFAAFVEPRSDAGCCACVGDNHTKTAATPAAASSALGPIQNPPRSMNHNRLWESSVAAGIDETWTGRGVRIAASFSMERSVCV